jgi:basic amino acid/polyamine antiporter, APA family
MARPFRTPFSPVFPLIGIVLCVYLMAQLPLTTWVRFFDWLAAGEAPAGEPHRPA